MVGADGRYDCRHKYLSIIILFICMHISHINLYYNIVPLCHGVELHFYWAHFYFQWTNSWRRRESHSTFNIVTNWASASQNFNSILFYHLKKLLYHYTIQFYNTSNIPNIYFTIQHIKIIFLCNKIIYLKTQIKTKTQITLITCCHRHRHNHHEEHTQTETYGHTTTPQQPQKPQPRNPWPPPSPWQPPTFTTMNPHMTHNKNPTPFHHHHGNPQLHHHEPTKKIHPKIKSNQ